MALSSPSGTIQVGHIVTYTFAIGNLNAIPSTGKIIVTFPSTVQIQSSVTCTVTTTGGAQTCAVDTTNQKITATMTSDVSAGDTITVSIPNGVRNPKIGQQSDPF